MSFLRPSRCITSAMLVWLAGGVAHSEEATGFTGSYVRASMDTLDCIHLVFTTSGWASSYYGRYNGSVWGSAVTLPWSDPCFDPYTLPTVDVGPSMMPRAAYGTNTGGYPYDLAYFTLAEAANVNGTSWTTESIGNDGYRRSDYGLAVDESDLAHLVYKVTNTFPPYWSRIAYRGPAGSEVVVRQVLGETYQVMSPTIAYVNGTVLIAWREGGSAFSTVNLFYAEGPPGGPFPVQQLTTFGAGLYVSGTPDIAVAPDGHAEMTYLLMDATSSPSRYTGVYSINPAGPTVLIDTLDVQATGASGPKLAFDAAGNRYVGWSLDAPDSSYCAVNGDTVVTLPGFGSIDVCAGTSAYYVRVVGSAILYGEMTAAGSIPTAIITGISPDPLRRGIDPTLTLSGTSFDNDEGGSAVIAWEWTSSIDGLLGSEEELVLPAIALSLGTHTVMFRCRDDEGVWSLPDSATLEVLADTIPPPPVMALSVAAGLGDTLVVSWGAVTDNLEMDCYRVFRGSTAWFDLDVPIDSVDAAESAVYIDSDGLTAGAGSAIYEVVPVDVDGNAAGENARAGAMQFPSGVSTSHPR